MTPTQEKIEAEKKELQEKLVEAMKTEMASLKEVVEKSISEKVEAEIKKLNLDKFDPTKMALSGKTPEEVAKNARLETGAKFVKALVKKDFAALAEFKTGMVEGTDSQGGYLVPTEVATEIDYILENVGFIRQFARRWPMTRDTLVVPNLATAMTVSVPGEATAQTDGSPVLGATTLAAKTVVGLALVSKELLADANQSVAENIFKLAGMAIAKYEDTQGLTGTGSPFTGVLGNSSVTVVTMGSTKTAFTDVTQDNLIDMIANMPSYAVGNAKFAMHRTVFAIIRKILEASMHIAQFANPFVTATVQKGLLQPMGFIEGYPVYGSDQMPAASATAAATKFVIFGNFDYFYLGDRQQITMDISDSATVSSVNAFASYQQAVRVAERVALAVGVPAAFVVLKTAAS